MAPFLGRYTGALSDIELLVSDGNLVFQVIPNGGFPFRDAPPSPAPPPAPAAFIGPDWVVVTGGLMKGRMGEFLRGPDGCIAWLRSSRIHAPSA
jgi:hypothetical protein